eukprot:gene36888-45503_t
MPLDEITEVKRVLREAKARKRSIATKLNAQSERINSDREELQSVVSGVQKTLSDTAGSGSSSKTTHLMLDVAVKDINRLRNLLASSVSNSGENSFSPYGGSGGGVQEGAYYSSSSAASSMNIDYSNEPAVDSSLLDMCRSLEEENHTLLTSMDTMKSQLAAAQSETDQNKLIPHYRLAIIRSRSYTANLLEQLKREQFTTETLRGQLEVTYQDLKKTVEEKKRLLKKLTKFSLQADERDSYPEYSKERYNQTTGQQIQQQQHQQVPQIQQTQPQHITPSTSFSCSNNVPLASHDPHYLHLLQQQAQFAQQTLNLQQNAPQAPVNAPQPQYAQSQPTHNAYQMPSQYNISPRTSTEHLSSYLHPLPPTGLQQSQHTTHSAPSSKDHISPRPSSTRRSSEDRHATSNTAGDIMNLQESAIQSELSVLDSEIDELKLKLERAAALKNGTSRSHRISESVLLGEQE